MNITPIANLFDVIPLPLLIIAGIVVLGIIILLCLNFLDFMQRVTAIVLMMVIATGVSILGISSILEKKVGAQEYIASLGLELKSGDVNVFANKDSEITVSKNGQDFQCTAYAPSDNNESIFFVCDGAIGYGRGSIEDLAKNVKDEAPTQPQGTMTESAMPQQSLSPAP